MMRPSDSTNTCSARLITACMTCSIMTMVMPRSRMAADDRHDVADLGGVEAGQHLVEQQQPRLGRQRARKLEPLAAGDRQRRGRPVEQVAQARPRARPRRRRQARRRARGRRQMRADRDVLPHRQARERLHDLEGAGDAAPRQPMRRLAGDVGAVVDDAALRSACAKPEMIENSVVLPAPFGPISAVMRPACASERCPVDGEQAAEALAIPARRASSGSTMAAAHRCGRRAPAAIETAPQVDKNAGDAARRERDDQDEDAAINDEIEARRIAGHELGELSERLDHQRAEQRAEDGADAADDRREQRLDRDPGPIGDAGIDEQEILRVEAAGRPR